MYQLLLSNAPQTSQSTQNAIDSIFALFGMSILLTFLIPTLMFVVTITILVLLGILTSSIAGKKGYNRFGFFWYGFFFFPIAVGVAILAPPLNKSGSGIAYQQDEDELAKYKEMYAAGTLSWTQYCQKIEELERKEYYK